MIRLNGVVKRFGDFTALNGLTCDIPDGSIWGLVGINGAGKSTLLRVMTGIYQADGGSVEYDGAPVFDNPEVKGTVSFVPDELYLPPNSNIEEMVKKYRLLKRNFNEQKLRELVKIFELNTKQRFNTFSKGMRRQAATALALAEENPYIFFDETFDGLDPFKRGFIKQILKEEAEVRGTTVIITSHSLRELEDVCDNLAILDRGNFVLDTDVAETKASAVKVQIAYADDYTRERLENLDVVSFVKRGAVAVVVIRGEEEEVLAKLRETSPLLLETLPLTLEETFSYNLDERKIVREEEGTK